AFSDGVFSIAITLLVLDIHVPPIEQADATGLLTQLLHLWPNLLAFVASFFFILVMWINHHRVFTLIRRSDNNLLLLNGLLLFGVILLPFPTALVAEYLQHRDETTAILVYNVWFLVIAIFFNMLWRYASHNNRLFTDNTDRKLAASITRQYTLGFPPYIVAIVVGLFSPLLSILITLALGIYFVLPSRSITKLTDADK
ncbi:MAG: TMEM175 family protein, partial [Chloroflexota bacterium]